jgi:glycosyltransferase involved in cell wall biosynthesis
MKLSIIIPCYNEKEFLPQLISLVKKSPVQEKEIILVDDGSDDGTKDIIKTQLENDVDKVVYHPENKGKGAAIQSALRHVRI